MVQDVTDHPNIVWSSGDSSVVTIDAGGLAKGVSPGMTLITATGQVSRWLPPDLSPRPWPAFMGIGQG